VLSKQESNVKSKYNGHEAFKYLESINCRWVKHKCSFRGYMEGNIKSCICEAGTCSGPTRISSSKLALKSIESQLFSVAMGCQQVKDHCHGPRVWLVAL
jgi:hypothetical protein